MSSTFEESVYDRTIRFLLHIYGIATSIALWVIAIYVIKNPASWSTFQGFQFYMILATAAVSLFELIFILAFVPCCWCCLCFRHINGWINACIYAALTIPIFIFTRDSALAIIWAVLLLILAFLHLLKSIQQLCHGSSSHPNKASTEGQKKASKGGSNDDVHLGVQPTKPGTNNYGATSEP